jgi:hypothetical protein
MSADISTTEQDEDRPDWVSQRAVAWVIDDAPVPADLAWTLVVIARRCNHLGKGSRQTTKTIAAKTGKSPKQAQRDVARLRALGLIVEGDQTLVAHLPAGKRPTVWDVPLHLKGPKPAKESRNPSGLKREDDISPMDGTPPLQGTPPMDGESTPPLHGVPTPPMDGVQKKPLKNPLNNPPSPLPPSDANAPTIPAPREGGDGEFDSDQEQRINTLVGEILTLRPGDRMWTRRTIRAAIDKCLTDGKPLSEIERAFPACAVDPETKAPGRLPMDFYWWALPDQLVPFCAACNDTGTVPYGDGTVEGICQACNPITDEMRGEFIRTLPNYPPCKHGINGGNVAMTGYGWMYCASCRHASGYVSTKAFVDQQPRSSERGGHRSYRNFPAEDYEAWHVRHPARQQHVPYLDPEDQSVYDRPL